MKIRTITTYLFKELSEDAQQYALDRYRENDFIGDYVVYEAIDSLKGFCAYFDLDLDYSIGLYPDRGEFIAAKIEQEEISELSGVRLFKYLEKSPRSTYINKVNGKVENTLSGNCPFTGFYYDERLLDAMREFMAKPDDRTFQELIDDCTSDLLKALHEEGEYLSSDEYLTEQFVELDYEFNQDGSVY